jgi:hypothetical protein
MDSKLCAQQQQGDQQQLFARHRLNAELRGN